MLDYHGVQSGLAKRHGDRRTTPEDSDHSMPLADLIRDEFYFVSCILTSPLHRQSKSPTLWFHRYWLINKFARCLLRGYENDETFGSSMTLSELIDKELGIVLRSAQRHPSNYYAWQFARRLINLLNRKLGQFSDGSSREDVSVSVVADVEKMWYERVLAWCLKNPTDISAWSHLYFMIKQRPARDFEAGPILWWMKHTQWRQEAACYFLRNIAEDEDLKIDVESRELIVEFLAGKPSASDA